MQWNRSGAIGIAKMSCTYCHGTGMRPTRYGKEVACNCAYRAVFRACFNRFRECNAHGAHASTVTLELSQGPKGRVTYSRKGEEFMADFCLVSKRVLSESDYKVFRLHFVLGAEWNLCCRRLRIDRGTFFHAVYRIEQQLGRIFVDLKPYPLYPLDEYFGGTTGGHAIETRGKRTIRQLFPDRPAVNDKGEQSPEKSMAAGGGTA